MRLLRQRAGFLCGSSSYYRGIYAYTIKEITLCMYGINPDVFAIGDTHAGAGGSSVACWLACVHGEGYSC